MYKTKVQSDSTELKWNDRFIRVYFIFVAWPHLDRQTLSHAYTIYMPAARLLCIGLKRSFHKTQRAPKKVHKKVRKTQWKPRNKHSWHSWRNDCPNPQPPPLFGRLLLQLDAHNKSRGL